MELTTSQQEIINLMRQGLTKEEIADKCCIGELTLMTYLNKLYPSFENVIAFKQRGKFEQLQKYLRSENARENITPPPVQTIKPPERINPETGEEKLTERENEVYGLLLAGYNYKEIAEELHIADTTVKTHVMTIFGKKQVNSLRELIIKGYKNVDKPEVKPVQNPAPAASEPQPVTVEKPAEVEETKPVTEATPQIVEPKATTNHADDLKNRIENELKTIQSRIAECKEIIKIAQIQKEILEKILKE